MQVVLYLRENKKMKIKTLFYLCAIVCLAVFSLQSCKLDTESDHTIPKIGHDVIEYDCLRGESEEVFIIIQNKPSYGSSEADLLDYLLPRIEIARLDEITDGNIRLKLIILKTGDVCLARVDGDKVAFESMFGFDTLFNNMPAWNPGKFRDAPIHAFVYINIRIINGEFELVL